MHSCRAPIILPPHQSLGTHDLNENAPNPHAEIHAEIGQKRKKKPSRDKGIPRQPHVYL